MHNSFIFSNFVPYNAIKTVEEDKLLEMIKVLEDSKNVNMVYHCDDLSVEKSLTKDEPNLRRRQGEVIYILDLILLIFEYLWYKIALNTHI